MSFDVEGEVLSSLIRLRACSRRFGLDLGSMIRPYASSSYLRAGTVRPRRLQPIRYSRRLRNRNRDVSDDRETREKYKYNINLQEFEAEEIRVTLLRNSIQINCYHEAHYGRVNCNIRNLCHFFSLPENIDHKAIVAKFSSDRILTIEVPKKTSPSPSNENRYIPIIETNTPAAS